MQSNLSPHIDFMRSPAILTLVNLSLLMALGGCGGADRDPALDPQRANGQSPSPSPSNSNVSRVFRDRLDREVVIPDVPRRVISLSPETTELLYAIGAGPSVVGVTDYCNYPEAAAELPKVGGGTMETLSLEAIVQLQPDLVLCKWDAHQPLVDRLAQMKIKAFAVGPTGLATLYDGADQLGRMLGCHDGAKRWTDSMKERMDAQRHRVVQLRSEKQLKVFYQVWHEPLMSVNDASFIGEVLRMAGLENVFGDLEAPFPTVSAEAVVERNPDIILAPNVDDTVVADILSRPGWATIRAVGEQRVHLINPDTISRCGPRLVDALREIIDVAYEDALPAVSERASSGEAP